MEANTVLVDRDELLCVLEEYAFCTALMNAGVVDWVGFCDAQDIFEKCSADLVLHALNKLDATEVEC